MIKLLSWEKGVSTLMITNNDIKLAKGSKLIIATLRALGVDTIFGYPGGIVLDVYDELYNQSDIRHILVRHEQSAVHAAEGYARVTGKCGVVLVTSGPGATNTVSGIVNAYQDGYPLLVLTGQVFKKLIGKDAFQEADICDIAKSCTKAVYQITDAADIEATLIKAMQTAMEGKKGPVVVDLVKDIFSQEVEYKSLNCKFDVEYPKFSQDSVERIVDYIKNSSRPVILSGGGVMHSKAEDELYNLADSLNIPVIDTMMGLSTFPQDHKCYMGMVGIFGDKAANKLLKESDLILSLGARFNDRITCMFNVDDLSQKLIQIDINPKQISGFVKAKDFVIADIAQFLSLLNNKILNFGINFSSWLELAQNYRSLNNVFTRHSNMLYSAEIITKINDYTKNKDVIFTSEVGQHQLWAVQNLTFNKNRRILLSGGSGTMGFGFPAAIGAAVAQPEKTVICIAGDGSFQMGIHELATCVDYGLNIKIMILNNGYLGMVRQLQDKFFHGRYSNTKISNPDYVTLAKSYGINAMRVSIYDDIDKALGLAFSHSGPFIIEFVVEPIETL